MPFDRVNIREVARTEVVAHDGVGRIQFRRLAERAGLSGACNFIDYAIVPPGASIGAHRHAPDEEEFYLVLSGTALMRLGPETFQVRAGDLIRNPPGGLHALSNDGTENVELFVFEVACDGRR